MKKLLLGVFLILGTITFGATPLSKEVANSVNRKGIRLEKLEILLTSDMIKKINQYASDVKKNKWDEDSVLVVSPSCKWTYNGKSGEDKNCTVEFDLGDVDYVNSFIVGTYVEYERTNPEDDFGSPTYNVGLHELFGPRYEFFRH